MKIHSIDDEHQLSILQKPAAPVQNIDGKTERLALEMVETMRQAQGLGLAGPQVGHSDRIFVVGLLQQEPMVFINPEIIATSEKTSSYEEGCLSIPGQYGLVWRPAEIGIQAWTFKGEPFTIEADGLLSTVIQHELDHLDGVLFIDYINSSKRGKILKRFGVKNYTPVLKKDVRREN